MKPGKLSFTARHVRSGSSAQGRILGERREIPLRNSSWNPFEYIKVIIAAVALAFTVVGLISVALIACEHDHPQPPEEHGRTSTRTSAPIRLAESIHSVRRGWPVDLLKI
jgi:hypothetical protein